jgi:Tfp pilus assembly protein PilF
MAPRKEKQAPARGSGMHAEAANGGPAAAELSPWALRGLLAVVFALSLVCFWPALSQGFVDWDDDFVLISNPYWRGLSAENLRWMFATPTAYGSYYMGHYQPLTWLSYAVGYELWGVSPERIHLVNLLLHASNAVLFCMIAARLLAWSATHAARRGAGPWVAAGVAALFFSMHPLRVESVAWATERRDLLSTFFLLACVLGWLNLLRAQGSRLGWWFVVLICYALSLGSKAWGMTLPAVLLVIDVWPLRRLASGDDRLGSVRRLMLEKIPFLPLALASAVLAARAQAAFGATAGFGDHGIVPRLAQACYGLSFYVVKTVWPTGLSPLYELEIDLDPTRLAYVASMLFVALLTAALVFLRKRFPGWLAAWVAFAIIVGPVLGILQSGAQRVADRYTYIACLPLALLLGAGAKALLERGGSARVRLACALSVAVGLVLGALTWNQTRVWRDSETLWRHVIRLQPSSYIAHHQLAAVLQKSGRIDEAIESEQRSIEAHPGKGNEDSRHGLGFLYSRMGRRDEALEAWWGALKVAPTHEPSIKALVGELQRRGESAAALEVWEQSIAHDPDFMEGYVQLALMLWQGGKGLLAEDVLRRAIARNPDHGPVLNALGSVVYQSGRHEEGEGYLRQALRANSRDIDTLTKLAQVLSAKPDDLSRGQAINMIKQALLIDPDHAPAQNLARDLGVPR